MNNGFTRRDFLKVAGLTGAALTIPGLGCGTEKKQSDKKPNIIFIMADDLGYGDLGCYGQERIKTPNIDALAAGGIKFTRAYSGSTVCAPSRSVLLTGLHTGNTRIRGNKEGVYLHPGDTTIAEVLKQCGYTNAMIGKWGLGEQDSPGAPHKKGFDLSYGYLNQIHAHNYYPEYLVHNDGVDSLNNKVTRTTEGYAIGIGGVAYERNEYTHDLFTDKALEFIDGNKDNPFFLYLPYTIPHANNEAGNKGPWTNPGHEAIPDTLGWRERQGMEVPELGQYEDKKWPEPEKGKAAMITRMDRDVGRIVEKLKDLGLEEDTVVFFTSDNGPHKEAGTDPDFFDSNGPLRGIKRDLYEGGIRVPMIVRWKGTIQPGRTSDLPCYFADVLPTLADLAGCKQVPKTDGISIVPELLGKEVPGADRMIYWEFHEGTPSRAAVYGKWKAVQHQEHEIELYNLEGDIDESDNIASAHPEIVEKIRHFMETARSESEFWPDKFAKPVEE